MAIHIQHTENTKQGGIDIQLSLTPAQAEAVGADAGSLLDWLDTALWAMALLRSGRDPQGEPHEAASSDWHQAINDLDHDLIPRLEGIRDAAVRAHAAAGGSVGDLALAMDVQRSTAQYRREKLLAAVPGTFEGWAAGGGPQRPRRA